MNIHACATIAGLALLAAGCGQSHSTGAETGSRAKTGAPADDVSDLLVEVNGHALTRSEAMLEVDVRLGSRRPRLQPDQLEQVRRQMLGYVAEQFVAKTLLTQEANRRGIVVTADDEAAAREALMEKLPPGVTVEQAMKESPAGEERMRQELLTAARIDKLVSAVITNTTFTDEQFTSFTNRNFKRLEAVHARHILIACKPTDLAVEREGKRTKAEALRANLLAGADFAVLARESSDCPSSERAGDLGLFGRGRMVKAFEEAAFQQQTNIIGNIVETQFGYHIIQVLDHLSPSLLPREKILGMMAAEQKKDVFENLVEGLRRSATIRFGPAMPKPRTAASSPHP